MFPVRTTRPFARLLASIACLALLVGCSSAEPVGPSGPPESGEQPAVSPSGASSPPSESPAEEPPEEEPEPLEGSAMVTRVIDGDTIEVAFRGDVVDVRLIGIDTPETVHPTEPVGCFGRAASRFTTNLVEGEKVRLEFDVERLDRYGRTLAYVWLGGEMVNLSLVAEGYAQVSTYPPNVKYVDLFVEAQRDARRHARGLWGACQDDPEGDTGGGGGGNGDCDPSYPDVCIPPYPPDLDCGEVVFTYFRVTGSDPHGFDGDDDGIGCES